LLLLMMACGLGDLLLRQGTATPGQVVVAP
jgi:hypothetical protein